MKLKTGHVDLLFILPALAGISMMADEADIATDAVRLSGWTQIIIMVPATLLIAFLASIGSKIDRRCSEDYLMQVMANAALIGVVTTLMINMLWGLGTFLFALPDLTGENMTGVTMTSWCTAYYWYRFRGITT